MHSVASKVSSRTITSLLLKNGSVMVPASKVTYQTNLVKSNSRPSPAPALKSLRRYSNVSNLYNTTSTAKSQPKKAKDQLQRQSMDDAKLLNTLMLNEDSQMGESVVDPASSLYAFPCEI